MYNLIEKQSENERILENNIKIECLDNIYRSGERYYQYIVSEGFNNIYDSFVDMYIEGASSVEVSDVFNTGAEAAKALVNNCAKEYVGNNILIEQFHDRQEYIDVYAEAANSIIAKVNRTIKKMYTEEDVINILTDSLSKKDVLEWFKNSKHKK